jgi:hypothetical protein
MLRFVQLDIAERLSHHVMSHHEEMSMSPTNREEVHSVVVFSLHKIG